MNRIFFIALLSVCAQIVNAQSPLWYSELLEHRNKTDQEYKTDEKSPIPKEEREQFTGLKYFEADKDYYITADFIRLKKPKSVWFATSNGQQREYFKFAEIKFILFGKTYSLFAYYNKEIREREGLSKHTFVPFKDLTNLVETYGGGRYLDFDEPEGNVVQLDFNRAYNPYCAYADGYSCPKVPEENYLNIRIPVGEKNLHSDH